MTTTTTTKMTTTTNTKISAIDGTAIQTLFDTLREAAGAVHGTLVEYWRGAACVREAQRLMAMSDGELAALGLRRDGIYARAFGRFTAS